MIRFILLVIWLAIYLHSIDSWAFSFSSVGRVIQCSARNSQAKYHKELIQNVAIRGEDERILVSGKKATMPLVCKSTSNKNIANGSINLVEGKRAVTVLHNLVNLSTCEPLNKVDQCSIYDGTKAYPIKWEGDPVEICKQNGGKDAVIETETMKITPKRKGYKVLCKSQLGELQGVDVSVNGAMAENFSGLTRDKFGKAIVEGKGKIFRVSTYENMVRYDSDSGKGTSGGAAVINQGGEEYIIGTHRGDKSTMSYSTSESGEDQSLDGLPADENDNYGEALIFPDEMKICGKK